jgi:hypothetical protein
MIDTNLSTNLSYPNILSAIVHNDWILAVPAQLSMYLSDSTGTGDNNLNPPPSSSSSPPPPPPPPRLNVSEDFIGNHILCSLQAHYSDHGDVEAEFVTLSNRTVVVKDGKIIGGKGEGHQSLVVLTMASRTFQ